MYDFPQPIVNEKVHFSWFVRFMKIYCYHNKYVTEKQIGNKRVSMHTHTSTQAHYSKWKRSTTTTGCVRRFASVHWRTSNRSTFLTHEMNMSHKFVVPFCFKWNRNSNNNNKNNKKQQRRKKSYILKMYSQTTSVTWPLLKIVRNRQQTINPTHML